MSFQSVYSGNDKDFPLFASNNEIFSVGPPEVEVSVGCYSDDVCPEFIRVNDAELTVHVDGDKTFSKKVQGMYILDVLVENTATHDKIKENIIVYLNYRSKGELKNRININKPWDVWITKKNLPYSIGKYDRKNKTDIITKEEFDEARKNYKTKITNQAALKELLSWTDDELIEAYAEA